MLCLYLIENKIDREKILDGYNAFLFMKEHDERSYNVYANIDWVYPLMQKSGVNPNILSKIFENGKKYSNDMEAFCKYFINQFCHICRYVAKVNGIEDKLDEDFIYFENFGKSIDKEVDLTHILKV